jgi:hypothetical protein
MGISRECSGASVDAVTLHKTGGNSGKPEASFLPAAKPFAPNDHGSFARKPWVYEAT